MAPMKFEEQMKDKLDQRNLKPSEKAWETIASQLDTGKGSKRRNTFFWYGIAAGFIGIIVVSSIYFSDQNQVAPDQNKVVETEKLFVPIEKEEHKKSQLEQQGTLEAQPNSSNIIVPGSTINNAVVSDRPKNYDHLKNGPNSEPSLDIARQDMGEAKVALPNQTNEVINAKIAQLVEQVDWLDQNKMVVTDAEIDSLLRKAQQEIIQQQLFRKDNTVDAIALLTQVEDEMDQSFRDQIFDALRDGFLKVRTAVATRNE